VVFYKIDIRKIYIDVYAEKILFPDSYILIGSNFKKILFKRYFSTGTVNVVLSLFFMKEFFFCSKIFHRILFEGEKVKFRFSASYRK